MNPYYAILFFIGFALMLADYFSVNAGPLGIAGICLILATAFMAAWSLNPIAAFIIVALIVAAAFFLFRLLKKGRLTGGYVFNHCLEGASNTEDSYMKLMGQEGKTVTPLNPQGKVDFQGRIIDVSTCGEFVKKGRLVQVIRIEEKRIIVKEVEQKKGKSQSGKDNKEADKREKEELLPTVKQVVENEKQPLQMG